MAMSVIVDPSLRQAQLLSAAPTDQGSSRNARRLRIAGVAARSVFLLALVIVTAHVSAPQTSRSIFDAHTSFSDLSLAAIGWGACLGVVIAMFRFSREPEAHRTWLYVGPAMTALLLVCAIAWW
jgi:hypothetical protein